MSLGGRASYLEIMTYIDLFCVEEGVSKQHVILYAEMFYTRPWVYNGNEKSTSCSKWNGHRSSRHEETNKIQVLVDPILTLYF